MEFVIDGEVWRWTRSRKVQMCSEGSCVIPKGGRGFRSSQNRWACKDCGEAMRSGLKKKEGAAS